jgi:hypothetical protein
MSGIEQIGRFPWRDVYYDDDLTTGANDGSSPADAWQSLSAMSSGVAAGDRVNMKKAASAVTLSANFIFPAGTLEGPIWYRGYGETPGDGVKWVGNAATFSFVSSNGPQLISDIDATSSGSSSTFIMTNDQTTVWRCDIESTGTGAAVQLEFATLIECNIVNSGTVGLGTFRAVDGQGAIIGCVCESTNGQVIDADINSDDGEKLLVFKTAVISNSSEAHDGINVLISNVEASYVGIIETSVWGADNAIFLGATTSPIITAYESGFAVLSCILSDCDHGLRWSVAVGNSVLALCKNVASGNHTSGDSIDYGDWTDLWDLIALSGDPYASKTDLSLNDTAGAGALCRNGVTVGLVNGAAAGQQYTSACDLGSTRHGDDDSGEVLGIRVGPCYEPRTAPIYIGIQPITKLSEIIECSSSD